MDVKVFTGAYGKPAAVGAWAGVAGASLLTYFFCTRAGR